MWSIVLLAAVRHDSEHIDCFEDTLQLACHLQSASQYTQRIANVAYNKCLHQCDDGATGRCGVIVSVGKKQLVLTAECGHVFVQQQTWSNNLMSMIICFQVSEVTSDIMCYIHSWDICNVRTSA